jgi:diaminopimelate epimerase
MKFWKYHALGNDYLVLDPKELPVPLTTDQVKLICHRNFGVGSDGILLGPLPSRQAPFALRIFNPDGSEAEKSGNGLRIFSRWLWDRKLVGGDVFAIETTGGVVKSAVLDGGHNVRVEMGRVPASAPTKSPARARDARSSTSRFRSMAKRSRIAPRRSATPIASCCWRPRPGWRSNSVH